MSRSKYLQRVIHLTCAAAGLSFAVAALGADGIPEVIVTAQKRAESIQDVPIAVTALSQSDLAARGLEGGRDILEAVPNVTFSKTNFTSFNLQIRGVGTKLVGGSGDQGVAIHMDNVPLVASRFFEAEFYDVDRVEVLRGPQGTLYGRNATGGVFNAITAKPTKEYESSFTLDGGNYGSHRAKAMVNAPLGDVFQIRFAGSLIHREGFMFDPVHNTDIDGRDIVADRITLGFTPSDSVHGTLMWEHFEENDDRQRAGKQLCAQDPGPSTVGGVSTLQHIGGPAGAQPVWYITQGCLPVSLYDPQSYSAINSNATLGGLLANLIGAQSGNAFAGKITSTDLRVNDSPTLPRYHAKSDIAVLNFEVKTSNDLTFTSLTSFQQDNVNSKEDYNRAAPTVNFNPVFDSAGRYNPLAATSNVFNDPQIGPSNRNTAFDISYAKNKTWTQEFRLQSAFSGPINFNIGANYLDLTSPVNGGYYVIFNSGTAYAQCFNIGFCNNTGIAGLQIPIDTSSQPDTTGRNYYINLQSYELRSTAGFGELYWQASDALKFTGGLRYTSDKKDVVSYPILLLSPTYSPPIAQTKTFNVLTGRAGFDWKLNSDSMLYAFYSRGYKAGGFNPATQGNVNASFDPEYVNSLEIGSKNTFADGTVQLNATAFAYKYKGYQISQIIQKTSVNSNIDADIYGAELELAWQPVHSVRLDGNVGYLKTKIAGGDAIDTMNRTQGNPALTVMKASDGSNCVVPTAGLASLVNLINNQTPFIPSGNTTRAATPTDLLGVCSGSFAGAPFGLVPSDGVPANLNGNELPNSPHFTVNVGAQKTFDMSGDWTTTIRGDYYYQSSSYMRIYNTSYDKLKAWSNANFSWSLDNAKDMWSIMAYVRNAFNKDNITDGYLTDDSSGLFTNVFLTDPRLYGLSITKRF